MKIAEVREAMKIAQDWNNDLTGVDDTILYGCGLPNFTPVVCTIRTVAKFLRYQCIMLNGEIDAQEFDNCAYILKRKVEVAGN